MNVSGEKKVNNIDDDHYVNNLEKVKKSMFHYKIVFGAITIIAIICVLISAQWIK